MRISTQTDIIFPAFGIDEGMKIFKEAGFDTLDFSMFYMNSSFESVLGNMSEDELVGKLLESSEKYSLPFNQAHAPFPSYRFGDEEYNKFVYEKLKLSIRIAGKIGASQIIVHPTACPDGVDNYEIAFDEDEALRRFEAPEIAIDVNLGAGTCETTMWTCDFSHDYVTINGDYRT